MLPVLTTADRVDAPSATGAALTLAALTPKGHETAPPARFTEASLIKELERLGIGRPSTYAATIGTIERRGYVFRQGKALVPSFTAFAVTHLLRSHFGDLVDVKFTAEMEEDLDAISRGELEWLTFIQRFFRGQDGFPGDAPALKALAVALLQAKADGPRQLGMDPVSGLPVYLQKGRFGTFVQLGENPEKGATEKPRRSSLLSTMSEATLTLDQALQLLRLPRELGAHPTDGAPPAVHAPSAR